MHRLMKVLIAVIISIMVGVGIGYTANQFTLDSDSDGTAEFYVTTGGRVTAISSISGVQLISDGNITYSSGSGASKIRLLGKFNTAPTAATDNMTLAVIYDRQRLSDRRSILQGFRQTRVLHSVLLELHWLSSMRSRWFYTVGTRQRDQDNPCPKLYRTGLLIEPCRMVALLRCTSATLF